MSNGLSAEARTRQRDESMSQAVKGLFLINGGAALALLAFLKDVYKDQPALASTLLSAIIYLSAGVFLAGAVHLVRYQASFHYQSGDDSGPIYRTTYLFCAGGSLVMFAVAMYKVIFGFQSVIP